MSNMPNIAELQKYLFAASANYDTARMAEESAKARANEALQRLTAIRQAFQQASMQRQDLARSA